MKIKLIEPYLAYGIKPNISFNKLVLQISIQGNWNSNYLHIFDLLIEEKGKIGMTA